MGHGQSSFGRRSSRTVTSEHPFKLFEYQCPHCNSKRSIQYFCRNGSFLPQAPRVVCGECNMSVTVEPFKTVDYTCPTCRKWQKVRLPAKPVPLGMYNMSVVSCNCGFRGEVQVGRLMDIACSQCWYHKRELRGTWTEDGDEVKTHCERCMDYQRAFAREPRKKGAQQVADLEFLCENCFRTQPVQSEELLRSQGLACCQLCSWVGYPEVVPRGNGAAQASQSTEKAATPSSMQAARSSAAGSEREVKARATPPSGDVLC